MGLSGRAVCRGNCSALGLGDTFFSSGRVVGRGNCSALGFGDTFFSHNIVPFITCFNLSQESAGVTAGIDMDHTHVSS